jgi:RNA polymerase sigma-70 factor (ECF subfamily)
MFDFAMMTVSAMETHTERIARGLRRRDIALLHQLVEQYQYRLVRYLIYLTGRRDQVDDIVQETWLRVVERGSSYDPRSRFEPWLFSIARNLTIDQMRKRKAGSLDTPEEEDMEFQLPTSGEPSPFEQAARSEDAQRMAKSLDTLEPIYREAVVLRFQEDLSLQEIAAIVKAPVTTVSSRIYRGLEMLRAQLEEEVHAN